MILLSFVPNKLGVMSGVEDRISIVRGRAVASERRRRRRRRRRWRRWRRWQATLLEAIEVRIGPAAVDLFLGLKIAAGLSLQAGAVGCLGHIAPRRVDMLPGETLATPISLALRSAAAQREWRRLVETADEVASVPDPPPAGCRCTRWLAWWEGCAGCVGPSL